MHMALHCADISAQSRSLDLAKWWCNNCMSEFFAQGDEEKSLNVPVSPLCDRDKTNTPKGQIGFIKFIVMPTFQALDLLLPMVGPTNLDQLEDNLRFWASEEAALAQGEMPSHEPGIAEAIPSNTSWLQSGSRLGRTTLSGSLKDAIRASLSRFADQRSKHKNFSRTESVNETISFMRKTSSDDLIDRREASDKFGVERGYHHRSSNNNWWDSSDSRGASLDTRNRSVTRHISSASVYDDAANQPGWM